MGNAYFGTYSSGNEWTPPPPLTENQRRARAAANAKRAVVAARKIETRINNALNNAAKKLANAKKKQNELSKAAAANVNNVNKNFKKHKSLLGRLKAVRARVATALRLGRN
jgi:flagellar hook-basal body complex protein FliE